MNRRSFLCAFSAVPVAAAAAFVALPVVPLPAPLVFHPEAIALMMAPLDLGTSIRFMRDVGSLVGAPLLPGREDILYGWQVVRSRTIVPEFACRVVV